MLTGVLIKRAKNSCFDQKRTSFISDLGAVTVVSGFQLLVIFTKFHQNALKCIFSSKSLFLLQKCAFNAKVDFYSKVDILH